MQNYYKGHSDMQKSLILLDGMEGGGRGWGCLTA